MPLHSSMMKKSRPLLLEMHSGPLPMGEYRQQLVSYNNLHWSWRTTSWYPPVQKPIKLFLAI